MGVIYNVGEKICSRDDYESRSNEELKYLVDSLIDMGEKVKRVKYGSKMWRALVIKELREKDKILMMSLKTNGTREIRKARNKLY